MFFCGVEDVEGPGCIDFVDEERILDGFLDTCNRCKMEDPFEVVGFADFGEAGPVGDRPFDELGIGLDIFCAACRHVVEECDVMVLPGEFFCDVGCDEAGAAGDEVLHF